MTRLARSGRRDMGSRLALGRLAVMASRTTGGHTGVIHLGAEE